MAAAKQERLINLTICLLSARRYITKDEIRKSVTNYADLDHANFDRMFERDKADLRERGIPIDTGYNDAGFNDEPGYRIPRAEFELPAVELTSGESTAVAIAAQLWQQQTLDDANRLALVKLRAIGADPDPDRASALGLAAGALTPSIPDEIFAVFFRACGLRQQVRFSYRDQQRTLEPWAITMRQNAWYVTGLDVDKQLQRSYRLNRVGANATLLGKPGAFERPEHINARDIAQSLEPQGATMSATLAIRDDAAPQLRRRGTLCEKPAPWPDYALYEIDLVEAAAVGDIAAAGDDVIVVEPEQLRDAVISHLRQVVGMEQSHA
ncbi:MAG: helix-turn-helix transcriptional regulator [Propionibacteriaceae bacterium]